mgnify:CR=1 FL=1
MNNYQRVILSIILFATSAISHAEPLDRTQQKIDADQQQYQQHQAKVLQPQADVRLDTELNESLSLSNKESPCYPIH